jgi:DNA-binding NarL/FixJ family response regulator
VSGERHLSRTPPFPGTTLPIDILIVDDHRPFRAALRALLQVDARLRIVGEAADGATATELARAVRPHVVIMDISMPGVGGVEATRQIMAQDASVAIIGLSLHADAAHENAMIEAGARCLIDKGGDSEAICAAILAWAGSARGAARRPPAEELERD